MKRAGSSTSRRTTPIVAVAVTTLLLPVVPSAAAAERRNALDGVTPVTITANPPGDLLQHPETVYPPQAVGSDRWMLEKAKDLGAPEELIDALLGSARDDESVPVGYRVDVPWPDVTGNGLQDVMAMHIVHIPGTQSGRLEFTMRDGLDGRALWNWAGEYVDGGLFPVRARVGRKGHNGVLMIKWEDRDVTFLGLSHRGRQVYEYSMGPLTDLASGHVVREESLRGFSLFDGLEGRATDILLEVGEGAGLEPEDAGVGLSAMLGVRARILDGRDGSIVDHEQLEPVAIRSPRLYPAPDVDQDGLEDYVAFPVIPDLIPEGQEPLPSIDGHYMRARKGTDGAAIWVSDSIEMRDAPLVWTSGSEFPQQVQVYSDLGDLVGDGRRDILVQVYDIPFFEEDPADAESTINVIDGETGWLRWHKSGWNPLAIGDVESDGHRDVITLQNIFSDDRFGVRLIARSGESGRSMYKRKHLLKKKMPEDADPYAYLYPTGDLEPDGIPEMALTMGWFRSGAGEIHFRGYYITARSGKRLPILRHGFIFAAVDGRGDDLLRPILDEDDKLRRLEINSGTSFKRILSLRASANGQPLSDAEFWGATPARFNRDRCVDILAKVAVSTAGQPGATFSIAIDGGSGRILWTQRRGGTIEEPPRVTARDQNTAC